MAAKEKQRKTKKIFTRKMQAKLVLVFCVIIVLFLALMGRLVYLNYEKGTGYAKHVLAQQTYVSSVIPYKRGDITDRKGTLFATSEQVYNLILEPKTILSKEEYYKEPTLNALVTVFGLERQDLEQILKDKPTSLYVVLKKEVSYEEKKTFEELAAENKKRYIQGVWFETQYRRYYPLSTVASDLIGFTSSGNVGNWGVEGFYNSKLNGTNGRKYGYFDSELNLVETVKGAVNGYNVVTTLDADVQRGVEKIIAEFDESIGAKNVGVVMMNPNNGEIYCMATNGNYDLNNPRDLTKYFSEDEIAHMSEEEQLEALNQIWRNFCISDSYEPGSTFKPFTVSACLEESIVGKNQSFICDGSEMIAGRAMRCVNRQGHGELSLAQSLMKSCNDVMMQISSSLGRSAFNRYQRLFGMGSRTGIDLQGEGYGLIFDENQLNAQELATSSFGQGLTVTMIQMVSGFSSLINGGYYYQPHVMAKLTNDAGQTVEEYTPVLMKKTVTASTSEFIRESLYGTVEEGTAKKAKTRGYKVGGKTGTAEKQPRGEKKYIVSFLGFLPYDNPEIVIYVIVDEPNVEDQSKCSAAQEMTSRIVSEICPILGIYPTEIDELTENEGADTENNNTEGTTTTGGDDAALDDSEAENNTTDSGEEGEESQIQNEPEENEDATHIYE